MSVSPRQRFTKGNPCPICGGGHDLPQGKGVRCTGFLSEDGLWPSCTRSEHAGGLESKGSEVEPRFVHYLGGPCKCGQSHGPAHSAPTTSAGLGDGEFGPDWTFRAPVPDGAPQPPWETQKKNKPTDIYRWTDEQGRLLFCTLRYVFNDEKTGDRRKVVTPRTCWERPDGSLSWEKKGPPAGGKSPLFNLQRLTIRADAIVLVTEGEKTCLATMKRFPEPATIATTWHGGSKSVHKTDWRPMAGRDVIIWPDADAPGLAAAQDVARACIAAGAARVRIVQLPAGLPGGWDLADPLPPGMTNEAIAAMVEGAIDFTDCADATAPQAAAIDPSEGDSSTNAAGPRRQEVTKALEGYRLDDEDLTETGVAIRFARLHQGRVKFARSRGWLAWDGSRFAEDDGGVQEMVTTQLMQFRVEAADLRREAGEVKAQATIAGEDTAEGKGLLNMAKAIEAKASNLIKALKELAKSSKIRGIMSQAESKPGIRSTPNEFDRDPWLFNVQNGIVDLRTGALSPHDPAAMMTKLAGTCFTAAATAPTWERFVWAVFQGDVELIRFVRQLIGYTLTGQVREQIIIILEGTGGNGKGVFLDPIVVALGDYATTVRKEVIILRASGDGQGDSDMANLPGARLASINELGQSDRLNVSRVKEMAGGEDMAANPKYLKPFVFTPCLKLWIRTNSLPEAKMDQALADRIVRIPFRARFRGTEMEDKGLKAKLIDELPGILNWAIEGARDWIENGLVVPAAVTKASADYVAEQDPLGQWIAQMHLEVYMSSARLHEAYEAWCRGEGFNAMSPDKFGKTLSARGWGSDNRRLQKDGPKQRVRMPPPELIGKSPVPVSHGVPSKIVSLPSLAHHGTPGTPFPPYFSITNLTTSHEESLEGNDVPGRPTCTKTENDENENRPHATSVHSHQAGHGGNGRDDGQAQHPHSADRPLPPTGTEGVPESWEGEV